MNRRGFLSGLAGLVAGMALDQEKLLWTPTKTIFIPPVYRGGFVTTEMITQLMLEHLKNQIQFVRFINRDYAHDFNMPPTGMVIQLRKPVGPQFRDLFPSLGKED